MTLLDLMRQTLYFLSVCIILLLVLPLLSAISLVIVVSSGFPVFYVQPRVGRNGRAFRIYKFRTMTRDADQAKSSIRELNEAGGPVFKIYHDPRFTSIGKFLSHTGLDELPQLFNIVRGDMAFIGPRPLPVDEARSLKPWQRQRHSVKPGIISPWIFEGYHARSFDEWMKSDVEYAGRKNVARDVSLLGKALLLFGTLIIREILRPPSPAATPGKRQRH